MKQSTTACSYCSHSTIISGVNRSVAFFPTKNNIIAVLTGRKLSPLQCFTNFSPGDHSLYSTRRVLGNEGHSSPARTAAALCWRQGGTRVVEGMHELRVAPIVRTPAQVPQKTIPQSRGFATKPRNPLPLDSGLWTLDSGRRSLRARGVGKEQGVKDATATDLVNLAHDWLVRPVLRETLLV